MKLKNSSGDESHKKTSILAKLKTQIIKKKSQTQSMTNLKKLNNNKSEKL